MKTLTKILIGTGVLVAFAGGVASARPMGDGRGSGRADMSERMLSRFDTDKDGTVTLNEFLAVTGTRFERIDTDKNGTIDKAEIESWIGRSAPAAKMARFLARHDIDGDGKITRTEWEGPAKKRFALFDRNDDGKLTREEIALSKPMRGHGKRHGMDGRDGGQERGQSRQAPAGQAPVKPTP